MSMISGQVDRLRTAAQTYRRLGNHSAESMLLEAADTICELQTENESLRDGANAMRQLYEDELKHALAENTKLRELVITLMACVSVDDCDKCPINGAEFKVSEVRCCYAAKQRMRELGVEVDG